MPLDDIDFIPENLCLCIAQPISGGFYSGRNELFQKRIEA